MADEEQLKFLRECIEKGEEGIKKWNSWREKHSQLTIDLSEARLGGANLSGADLSGAKLSGAYLTGVNLSGAYLGNTFFTGAYLSGANFTGARFIQADLTDAYLDSANFTGAYLYRTNLTGAMLTGANFSDTYLYNVEGLLLDKCRVVHTGFEPRAKDRWSVLRRTYTGPSMVLNLIFMLLFFAPMIIKGAGLAAIGDVQNRTLKALNAIPGFELKAACTGPEQAIIGIAQKIEISIACHAEAMWKLLLGIGGPYGSWMPVLTIVLILYQIARYLMTQQISLMRDAEERSGISPPKDGWFAYPKLYIFHKILSWIFFIGLIAFGLRAYEFLVETQILLPG